MLSFKRLACLILALMMMAGVCASADTAEVVCEHEFEEIVLLASTCSEPGIGMKNCTLCGEREYISIPPAHTFNEVPDYAEPATCDTEGFNVWYCTVCNAEQNEEAEGVKHEIVPPTHTYGEEIVYLEHNCVQPGRFVRICTLCGHEDMLQEDDSEDAAALGHKEQEETREMTCTECKMDVKFCTVCGEITEILQKYEDVMPEGHKRPEEVTVLKEADCENAAQIAWDCVVCGEHIEETDGEPLGHSIKDFPVIEATCTEGGVVDRKCERCDLVVETGVEVPPSTVCMPYEVILTPATCTEVGIKEERCKWCDAHISYATIPSGHEEGDVVTTVAPTCHETGIGHVYCMVCNEQLKELELPATGHAYSNEPVLKTIDCSNESYAVLICDNCGEEEVCAKDTVKEEPVHQIAYRYVAPTCEKDGQFEVYCSVCDEIISSTDVENDPALGHVFPETRTMQVAPTCEEPGSDALICTRCGEAHDVKEVPAVGHTEVIKASVEATCTTEGLGSKVCDVCGLVIEENIVLPIASECESKEEVLVAATCTADGLSKFSCKWCDKALGYAVLPSGHVPGDPVEAAAATCSAEGCQKVFCQVCNEEIESTVIPCLEHTFDKNVIGKEVPATCDEAEEVHYYCQVCNAQGENNENGILIETIGKAAGHIWNEETYYVEADCAHPGYTARVCTVCGIESVVSYDRSAPALGHKTEFVTLQPNCTDPMIVAEICTVCGYEIDREEAAPVEGVNVAALGHVAAEEWTIIVEPTCTTVGQRSKLCTVCGEAVETEEMPIVPCKEEVDIVLQASDCTIKQDSVSVMSCVWCEKQLRVVCEPFVHTFSEETDVVITEPTCDEEGAMKRTCALCGHEEIVAIEPVGHTAGEPTAEVATCDTPSRVVIRCTVCGDLLEVEAELTEPLGHNFGVYDPEIEQQVCIYCHATQE